MNETALHLWLAGDLDRDEWAGEIAWLRAARGTREFARLADVLCAVEAGAEPPDLLVISQARPGEIGPAEIDAIRRLVPLMPIVQVAGSWCEGELRSGRPWRASERLYWHLAFRRLEEGFRRHAAGRLPCWGLPLTLTEDERLLERMAGSDAPSEGSNLQFAIRTTSHAMGDWLATACRSRGARAVVHTRHQSPDLAGVTAGIWDGCSLADPAERSDLARFAALLSPRPVVALLSFPRIDDLEHARSAGAARIVSKPFLAEDLFAAFA